jgi:hypothetical protein
MGTYSFFDACAGDCDIDWDAMDTVLFQFRRFEPIHAARVKTCAEAGAMLIESKLFGYMTDDLISAFYEFNRHLVPNGQKPVWIFHTEHDNLTRAVRFYPGEERVEILGGEWM